MNCKLCSDPITNPGMPCAYCGHRIIHALDEQAEQSEKKRLRDRRDKLFGNIAEVGLIAYLTNPIFCPLLRKPAMDAVEWTEQRYLIYNSDSAASTLYMKTTDGKQTEFNATLTAPAELGKFQIGASINEHLKLELYYRKPGATGIGEPLAEEIKLGESLFSA